MLVERLASELVSNERTGLSWDLKDEGSESSQKQQV